MLVHKGRRSQIRQTTGAQMGEGVFNTVFGNIPEYFSKEKKMLVSKLKITGLLLVLLLQTFSPILKVSAQIKPEQVKPIQNQEMKTREFKQIPRLNPALQIEIESFAQIVAENLVFNENGIVSVDSEKANALTIKERKQLADVVKDITDNHIGLAFADEKGVKVYGNTQALNDFYNNTQILKDLSSGNGYSASASNIGTWSDGYGFAIYLDPVITSRIKRFDAYAIGAIVGLLATFTCSTVIGCLAVAAITSWFWDQVWSWLDRRYFADSLIIHAPRWGWVYVQPFKSRAWFDGQWFRTWLWT